MLEHECVATYIHALHSRAPASKNTLAVVQRHKSKERQDLSVNSPVPTTSGSAAQRFSTPGWLWLIDASCKWLILALSLLSAGALETRFKLCCWCIVWRLMQYIVGFFAYHKKGEIHGSSILKKQANKQQCRKRKLLSSRSKKNLNPGKEHIKKSKQTRGNTQKKTFPLQVVFRQSGTPDLWFHLQPPLNSSWA